MLRASLHIVYCTAKTQNTSIITQSSAAQDWFKSYLLPCLHWLNIKMKLNVFLSSKGELNVYHLPPGKYHVNSLSVIKYLLLLKTENHFLGWIIQPKKSSNAFTKVLKCLQHSGNEYFIINNYFNQLIIFKPLSTTPWIFSTTIFHCLRKWRIPNFTLIIIQFFQLENILYPLCHLCQCLAHRKHSNNCCTKGQWTLSLSSTAKPTTQEPDSISQLYEAWSNNMVNV